MNESSLVTACLKLLQLYENQGKISWYSRIFTGNVFIPGRGNIPPRMIRGAEPGTPDLIFIRDGKTYWIECKRGSKRSKEQEWFAEYVSYCEVIESVEDLKKFIEEVERES